MYTSKELRKKYLQFFEQNGHAVIASASLIPENDPSVLFTTAGMHPLIPYLMGQPHPKGTKLCDVQKCVRTGDIEEVGDSSHLTFFEMLGNWSLGDYFKEQSITWSWQFLTDKQWLGLDPNRIAVSVFQGDEDCQRDEESASVWQKCGVPKERIFYLPKKNNWWIAGTTGPCGPDTEIFWDTGKPSCGPDCSPACDCGKYLEIWNNVFMQFNKLPDGSYQPLSQKNVDTGMGLERVVATLNGCQSVYEIDLFQDAIKTIEDLSQKQYGQDEKTTKAMRIIADHTRTATFMLGDEIGVVPSNVDKGYVLRRLIRRAVRFARQIGIEPIKLVELCQNYVQLYKDVYPELQQNHDKVIDEFTKEVERFTKTLELGEKEFFKVISHLPTKKVPGGTAFKLYDTFGFPIEITQELATENGYEVDLEGFKQKFAQHQAVSHASNEHFKGGLADNSQATTELHTATHLLQAALRKVLGDEVKQKGSNITTERLRFDFSFHRPVTPDELKEVQALVQDAIDRDLTVACQTMTVAEAKEQGAIGLFESKYGEQVKVYTIGDFSKEICGGPHAEHTGTMGKFIIQKEQSSSAGVRRIKAVLQK